MAACSRSVAGDAMLLWLTKMAGMHFVNKSIRVLPSDFVAGSKITSMFFPACGKLCSARLAFFQVDVYPHARVRVCCIVLLLMCVRGRECA